MTSGSLRARVLAVAAATVFLVVAGQTAADEPAVGQRLTILHTSDVHGRVLPFDDARNEPADGSLTQVATIVARVRSEVDHPVLVLDSGDAIQGTPLEYFTSVRAGEPSPTIAAMNAIAYDAMAVGNHEFNFGLGVLRRAERQAEFPFLSANSVVEATGEPAFEPYRVFEVGGARVGVLGLVTSNIPGWERPENYRGLRFDATDAAARRWVPVLREKEGCDLVVVLAHTGFERDLATRASTGTEHEDFAWRLTCVPGVDVLLTGHSHQDLPPQEVNGVIVSQPQSYALRVTRIDLDLEKAAGGWRIGRWQGCNLSTGVEVSDPRLERDFAEIHERVTSILDGPVSQVTASTSVGRCRLEDCAAVDLLHAVQREATGAELSLACALSDATPDLPAGTVTWRWVYAFYVYPNTLTAVRVTGAQVKDILEHSARFYDGLRCGAGAGCTVLTDASIPTYNVDSVAGVEYRVDPTRTVGDRVRDLRYEGLPVDRERVFVLACNNYRAAGGGSYPHLAEAEVVWSGAQEVTDLLGEFLERHDPWRPRADHNWVLAPDVVEAEAVSEDR